MIAIRQSDDIISVVRGSPDSPINPSWLSVRILWVLASLTRTPASGIGCTEMPDMTPDEHRENRRSIRARPDYAWDQPSDEWVRTGKEPAWEAMKTRKCKRRAKPEDEENAA